MRTAAAGLAAGQGNIGRRQRRRYPISYRVLAGPAEDREGQPSQAEIQAIPAIPSRPQAAGSRQQAANPAARRPFSQAQGPCLTARGLVDLPGTSHKALLPLPYQFAACRMPKPRRPTYEGMSQQARRILHADQNQPWSLAARPIDPYGAEYAYAQVAYTTVRHAMAVLRDRGIIITVHGRGTFVAPRDPGNT